jgi:hypothetical protein
MKRTATLAVAVAVAGCSLGAPPGFSGGDSWTFPLVGPLEDTLLVVPVFVNDKGPYLMAIDPDAPISAVDQALVNELDLRTTVGGKILDETDTNRQTMTAEVRAFQIGDLTVRSRYPVVMKVGSFAIAGRHMRGVLGRDVIADSLVFGFDRDKGVGYLATQKGFTPPADATVIGYDLLSNRLPVDIQPVGRRIAKVQIDGKSFDLHLDLGAVTSSLRPNLWGKAGLTAVAMETDVRDEAGTVRHYKEAAVGNQVVAGGVSAGGVLFVPFGDKRWEDEFIDGTLGLNFFKLLNVRANWDAEKVYVIPRGDVVTTAAERVKRWRNATLDGCAHLGCVEVGMIEPEAAPAPATPAPATPEPAPAAPGASAAPGAAGPPGAGGAPAIMPRPARPVLTVTRDESAKGVDLEVTIGALAANGQPLDLPRLVVNLPTGVDRLSNQLDPTYGGTKLVVLDVSPFPRQCPRGGGCIAAFASPP